MKLKKSNYCIVSNSTGNNKTPQSEIFVFSTRTEKGLIITKQIFDLLQRGDFTSIPDKFFISLMYCEIIVPQEENELEIVISRKLLLNVDADNRFRSVYFYPDQESAEKCIAKLNEFLNITPSEVANIVIVTSISHNIEGGLIAIGLIKQHVSKRISTDFKINYELNMFTNGILGLLELLPLSNPGYDVINFIFQSEKNHSLLEYLKQVVTFIRLCSYSKQMKINLLLNLNDSQYFQIQDSIHLLKILSTENIKINLFVNYTNSISLSDFDEIELAIIKMIKANGIGIGFVPNGDSKSFYKGANNQSFDLFYEYSSKTHDNFFGSGRTPYDEVISNSLINNEIECSTCVYLPICGGRIDKVRIDNKDCPTFTRNFVEKVKIQYKI